MNQGLSDKGTDVYRIRLKQAAEARSRWGPGEVGVTCTYSWLSVLCCPCITGITPSTCKGKAGQISGYIHDILQAPSHSPAHYSLCLSMTLLSACIPGRCARLDWRNPASHSVSAGAKNKVGDRAEGSVTAPRCEDTVHIHLS
jgi:hypothetical protein